MQLQMTTSYALDVLVFLASEKTVIASTVLSEKLFIPHKYLLRIGQKLKKIGLIGTVSGPTGGYYLLKKPCEVSVYDVVTVLEGPIRITRCLEADVEDGDKHLAHCKASPFFKDIQQYIEDEMKKATLASLAS